MDVETMPQDAELRELVERLRLGGDYAHDTEPMQDAAEAITTLQAENERLREALEEMTEICAACTFDNIRIRGQYVNRKEAVGRARAALATAQDEGATR